MHIEYYHEFIVLTEELNYRAAAERLHISQSALSKHVVELERHHNMQLLERDRASVRLTAEGAVFLEQALELDALHDKMVNLFDKEKPLTIGGVLDNPLDFPLISRAFTHCQEQGMTTMPVVLSTDAITPEDLLGTLRNDNADCLVLITTNSLLSTLEDRSNFTCEEIFRIPLDCVVRRNNPLSSRKSLTIEDFADKEVIRLVGPRFSFPWNQLEAQFAQAHIPIHTKLTHVFSAYDYITIDPGDALYPVQRSPIFTTALENPTTVRIPIDDDRLYLAISAFYRKQHLTEPLRIFLDSLAQAFHEGFPA